MFLKLTIAAAIILATIVGMARIKRHLDGDSDGPLFGGKRKREEPASRSDLKEFVAAYRRERAGTVDAAAPASGALAAGPAPVTATESQVRPKARAAYLDGAKKLMYLVLKTGLPDHHVFVNCSLVDLLEPGSAIPPTLIHARADFAVCRSDLRVVAVIDVGAPADALKAALGAQLTAAGIRYLWVQPPALPKPAQLRSLIYPG